MPEYKSLTLSECADRILSADKPLIVMHKNPDGDTVGSAAAMCKIFRALGREPYYACSDRIPERLKFILEGEMRFDGENTEGMTVVAVDVATPLQLGGISERISLFHLMIDHHEVGVPFADNFIIKGASSCAEVVLEIALELQSRGAYSIGREIAYPLYAGISSDTGGFRYSSTSPETMRRAAALMECGIDFSDINHKLFSSKSPSQIRVEGFVGSNLKTALSGRVAYATITLENMAELGAEREDLDTAVDIVRCSRGAEIAFIAKELAEGGFKISIRSTGADVAAVAKVFGGGGHIRASGCTVKADTPNQAESLILVELEKII